MHPFFLGYPINIPITTTLVRGLSLSREAVSDGPRHHFPPVLIDPSDLQKRLGTREGRGIEAQRLWMTREIAEHYKTREEKNPTPAGTGRLGMSPAGWLAWRLSGTRRAGRTRPSRRSR